MWLRKTFPKIDTEMIKNGDLKIMISNRVHVKFPYNSSLIQDIKCIPTRQWHPETKEWSVEKPYLYSLISAIQPYYNFLADQLEETYGSKPKLQNNENFVPSFETSFIDTIKIALEKAIPTHIKLYPFQIVGVAFAERNNGRILLADEMGLGKTIVAAAWLAIHKDPIPALIVVQASLKRHWEMKLNEWVPKFSVYIIKDGKDPIPAGYNIFIINYDLLHKVKTKLQALKVKTLILDECQLIKEPKSLRTKNSVALAKSCSHVLALTGTPILNRPRELFSSLNIISPTQFPKRWQFYKQYCGLYYNGFAWVADGATHIPELRTNIQPFTIRRMKKDVLPDLPDKRREIIYVDMPDELFTTYKKAEDELISFYREFKEWKKKAGLASESEDKNIHMTLLSKLNYLRQIVGIAKAKQSLEIIQSFVDAGKKLIVFAHHLDVLNLIENYLKKEKILFVRVDGSVTGDKRQQAVDTFQTDDNVKIFLGGITAAGMGITLTAASDSLFIERMWTPSVEEQAEDRNHRIGTKTSVTAWYLTVVNTVDDKLAGIVESKRKVISALLQGVGKESSTITHELLEALDSSG